VQLSGIDRQPPVEHPVVAIAFGHVEVHGHGRCIGVRLARKDEPRDIALSGEQQARDDEQGGHRHPGEANRPRAHVEHALDPISRHGVCS
jgi:hypothetical protein